MAFGETKIFAFGRIATCTTMYSFFPVSFFLLSPSVSLPLSFGCFALLAFTNIVSFPFLFFLFLVFRFEFPAAV